MRIILGIAALAMIAACSNKTNVPTTPVTTPFLAAHLSISQTDSSLAVVDIASVKVTSRSDLPVLITCTLHDKFDGLAEIHASLQDPDGHLVGTASTRVVVLASGFNTGVTLVGMQPTGTIAKIIFDAGPPPTPTPTPAHRS